MIRKNKIKIALAQYPILQHSHFDSWKTYVEKWIQEAVASECDLLVFPEYASIELISFANEEVKKNLSLQIKYLFEMNNRYVEFFQNRARQYSVFIVAPSIPVFISEKDKTVNRCYLFSKTGQMSFQDKLFMTRFENEQWSLSSSEAIQGEFIQKVFETEIGNISISTGFDVEFSEPSFSAALAGADILIAPSCTETVKGYHRVHIGARARALENQFYVGVAQTIGEAPWSIAADLNTGCAALYSTPDIDFPEDGVVARGVLNKPGWLTAQVSFEKTKEARESGSVFNFKHRQSLPPFGRIKYQIDVVR